MDNDDAIVGRILTRRDALRAALAAGAGLAVFGVLPSRASARAAVIPTTQPHLPLIASPELTEGPFFVDERLNRSNLLEGTSRESVIKGLPLTINFSIYKMSGKSVSPMPGAMIDVWHADAHGAYSDESNPMNHANTAGENWLRGYQVTDTSGAAAFQTIFPGWYEGRAPHVHFKVRLLSDMSGKAPSTAPSSSAKEFTSQLFFRDMDVVSIYSQGVYASTRGNRDTTNETDNVFTEPLSDGTPSGAAMLLDLIREPGGRGLMANFPVILTDAGMHGRRSVRGGGPGGFDGGRGGPPPDGFGPGDFGPPPGPPRRNGNRPTSRPSSRLGIRT